MPRVAHSLSHTSPLCLPSARPLLRRVLFAVVLCFTMYLTFVHLFTHKTDYFFLSFFFQENGVIFLSTGCFVLSVEQVGRLTVTREEC